VTAIALQHPKLFHFLTAIDEDLAARRRSLGCSFCGGVLHSAAYPRKPCGAPWAPPGVPTIRHSFCRQSCRSRNMPASVRFLGRRVYPGFIVILLSMMQRGVTDRGIDELRITLGLARRTLQRWRHWWRQIFVQIPLWQYERGNFMPTIDESALPMSLLGRFANGWRRSGTSRPNSALFDPVVGAWPDHAALWSLTSRRKSRACPVIMAKR
jgi:hypothetical protein